MLPFPWISVILYSFIEIKKKYHILSEQDKKKTSYLFIQYFEEVNMVQRSPFTIFSCILCVTWIIRGLNVTRWLSREHRPKLSIIQCQKMIRTLIRISLQLPNQDGVHSTLVQRNWRPITRQVSQKVGKPLTTGVL